MSSRRFKVWLLVGVLGCLASSHASAQAVSAVDPTLATFLAQASASQLGLLPPVTHVDPVEPPGLALRQRSGWVRSGSAVAIAAGGMLIGWAAMLEGSPDRSMPCDGIWTPVAMTGPLIIGSALAIVGALQARKMQRAGIQAWPITRARRAMRIFGTTMGVLPVLAAGAFTNWEDHHCL